MIRFVDISNQIANGQFNFCWYDTVTDGIIEFSGEQVFEAWNDFEEAFKLDTTKRFTDIKKFMELFPEDKLPEANIHPQLIKILNDIEAIRCSQKYEYDKGWGHMHLYLIKNTEGDCLKYEEVKAIIKKHFGERVTCEV